MGEYCPQNFFEILSLHFFGCTRYTRLWHGGVTCSFHLFICSWDAIWHFSHLPERETEKALVWQNRHSHSVIQSGHPITSFFCPMCVCVGLSVSMHVCVCVCELAPLLSVLLAPCSVLPPREGGSRLFEVSLQLRGLTPQVSPWLFTQSWCNSAGKLRLCHEYKAGLHSNGVSFTSTLILFWPVSDRVTSRLESCTWQNLHCKMETQTMYRYTCAEVRYCDAF